MALPQHKTCLSVLRTILGSEGNENQFAEKIGRSVSWLKKASCGQIPLTRNIAVRIGHETGVNVDWLFKSDITQPPINDDNDIYTFKTYLNHQELLKYGIYENNTYYVAELLKVYGKSIRMNKGSLFNYYLRDFIFNMSSIFKK